METVEPGKVSNSEMEDELGILVPGSVVQVARRREPERMWNVVEVTGLEIRGKARV